jgi:hypothetical protein
VEQRAKNHKKMYERERPLRFSTPEATRRWRAGDVLQCGSRDIGAAEMK